MRVAGRAVERGARAREGEGEVCGAAGAEREFGGQWRAGRGEDGGGVVEGEESGCCEGRGGGVEVLRWGWIKGSECF